MIPKTWANDASDYIEFVSLVPFLSFVAVFLCRPVEKALSKWEHFQDMVLENWVLTVLARRFAVSSQGLIRFSERFGNENTPCEQD